MARCAAADRASLARVTGSRAGKSGFTSLAKARGRSHTRCANAGARADLSNSNLPADAVEDSAARVPLRTLVLALRGGLPALTRRGARHLARGSAHLALPPIPPRRLRSSTVIGGFSPAPAEVTRFVMPVGANSAGPHPRVWGPGPKRDPSGQGRAKRRGQTVPVAVVWPPEKQSRSRYGQKQYWSLVGHGGPGVPSFPVRTEVLRRRKDHRAAAPQREPAGAECQPTRAGAVLRRLDARVSRAADQPRRCRAPLRVDGLEIREGG